MESVRAHNGDSHRQCVAVIWESGNTPERFRGSSFRCLIRSWKRPFPEMQYHHLGRGNRDPYPYRLEDAWVLPKVLCKFRVSHHRSERGRGRGLHSSRLPGDPDAAGLQSTIWRAHSATTQGGDAWLLKISLKSHKVQRSEYYSTQSGKELGLREIRRVADVTQLMSVKAEIWTREYLVFP